MNGGSSASGIFQLAPAQVAVRVVLGALISWLGLGALGVEAAPSGRNSARLNPGDIVFTDSEAAVMRLDPVTMQPSVLAVGGPLVRPCGIAVSPEKTIYVTDTGSLSVIAINPETGNSTVLSQGGDLGVPIGIAVDADGEILVANGQAVLGINPVDGSQRTLASVASSSILKAPLGVASGQNGDLYVADAGGCVARIDRRRGSQTIVAIGQNIVTPVGILFRDHKTVYVADASARRIIHVDPRTGVQNVVSAEGTLASPFGLALWGKDSLLVGDPDAFGLAGGIISVDLRGGAQLPLATGSGNLVNFRCVAVVPGE